jgi:hypothetical protein
MELDGNEKKIQALYSELRLETDAGVPSFGSVWARATIVEEREVRRPMALLIAFSVIAIACSFAIWLWYRSPVSPVQEIAKQLPASVESSYKPAVDSPRPKAQPRRHHRTIRRKNTDRWTTTEAAMLSSWQSPTVQFMESPTSLTLSSLPKLNQSVKDLESFLPRNNEIMKESNR